MTMADICDKAGELIQFHTDNALACVRNRTHEQPIVNDMGLRICKDCNNLIPIARVQAVNAVRCVDCESAYEGRQ